VVLLRQGKLDEARTEFAAALRLKPDYADAHNNLELVVKAKAQLNEAGGRPSGPPNNSAAR
jgi:hypothetical protein